MMISGGVSLICEAFSKNQLTAIALDREESWGQNVVNRESYSQWRALCVRLGMTRDTASNITTLRSWMETHGPVASVGRGGVREARDPRPGRSRRHDEMAGPSQSRDRDVRRRYDRSGSSGRTQGRTRDDY